MGTVFYKTLKTLFHVLLGLVLGGKNILVFRKKRINWTLQYVSFNPQENALSLQHGLGNAAVTYKVDVNTSTCTLRCHILAGTAAIMKLWNKLQDRFPKRQLQKIFFQLKAVFRKLEAQSKCYSKVVMPEFCSQFWCCCFSFKTLFLHWWNIQCAIVLWPRQPWPIHSSPRGVD